MRLFIRTITSAIHFTDYDCSLHTMDSVGVGKIIQSEGSETNHIYREQLSKEVSGRLKLTFFCVDDMELWWQWREWGRTQEKKLSLFSFCFCDSLVNSVGLHFSAKKFVVLWEVISYRQYSSHTTMGLPKNLYSSSLPSSHAYRGK